MTAVVLVYLGLLLAIVGVIATVKPVGPPGTHSRLRGVVVLLVGVAMAAAGSSLPAPEIRVGAPVSRLDEFASVYQFHEFHSIHIAAPADRTYAAIKEVTPDEITLFHTLTWIRRGGRPAAPGILNAPEHQPLLAVATRTSFLLLAEAPNREIVFGTAVLVPPGWRAAKRPTADDYKSLRTPGFALASMNFLLQPQGANACELITETRVYATDPESVARFGRCWRVIYPGSALIRRMWLRAIKRRAESEAGQLTQDRPGNSGTM